MFLLKGKFNSAKVFAHTADDAVVSQIMDICNEEAYKDYDISIMPDCHVGKGSVIGFTGKYEGLFENANISPNFVGVDIGCLDKDSEFLTSSGWKKMDTYVEGDNVLQYNPEKDTASFITPLNYIVLPCNKFYHFKNSKGLDQMLSAEHNMLVYKGFNKKGRKQLTFKPFELNELSTEKGYYTFKASFNIENNQGVDLSDSMIKLDVMLAADGCLRYRGLGDNRFELHLKNERKIKRAKDILDACCIKFTSAILLDGSTMLYFHTPKYIDKDLSKYWKANKYQLEIIREESLLWDGHTGVRSFFSSTNKDYADIIQFAFSATNQRAGISVVDEGKENWKPSYIVTPTKNNFVGYTKSIEVPSKDGKKYCFTVPSGFFVARRGGKIFLTGNCGVTGLVFSINTDSPSTLNNEVLADLDDIIRKNIPSGGKVNGQASKHLKKHILTFNRVQSINGYTNRDTLSLGTLGGGNHFIELGFIDTRVNRDHKKPYEFTHTYLLTVHSGSRNLGKRICEYYVERADKETKEFLLKEKNELINQYKQKGKEKELPQVLKDLPTKAKASGVIYGKISPKLLLNYLEDQEKAVLFAKLNRTLILETIIQGLGIVNPTLFINTTHNYVEYNISTDADERSIAFTIRKGAVKSTGEGQNLALIPMNMRDGILLVQTDENAEMNDSMPHGAGRLYSRGEAKQRLSLDEFQDTMKDVFTTCVNQSTLDESPSAYKPMEEIISQLEDHYVVTGTAKPIYNFKASE